MPRADIDRYPELPRIEGKKLKRFEFKNRRKKDIEYLELLGNRSSDEDLSERGIHGYVFKVRIDGELYALKIFRFFDPQTTREQLALSTNAQVTDEDIEGQTDPFYAECRAYGTIAYNHGKKEPRKRPIAVACHGFLSVSATMEDMFAKRFGVVEWDRPEKELALPVEKRQPLRALVKDLVEWDPPVTEQLIKSMLRELKSLNSLGVYVMDIAWRNYKGGHIVDFSSAWTEPYFSFRKGLRGAKQVKEWKEHDRWAFDRMVKEELRFETNVRAVSKPVRPDEERLRELRPERKRTPYGK